ncbi:uncharacterized protein LDX57_000440 [Aspergillus melleus]|uniref:uncharacterized protein n=1 Tax=Aspergillus melleus TaxID=138277 RepID=UPI001E8E8FF4|nr:uncharacterized protein LDX57_000440 [Aspergillus melleus]KAH8422686.1 hypothetical protein LDX57_000440 [Aspergillus melleus]
MSSTPGEATRTPTSLSTSPSDPQNEQHQQHLPPSTSAATTSAPSQSIPTAQPGSLPSVPAPTGIPAPEEPTLQPTKTTDPTTSSSSTSPPAPRPGAQPEPLPIYPIDSSTNPTSSPSQGGHGQPSAIPPPPKAGDGPPNPQPGGVPLPTPTAAPIAPPLHNSASSTHSYMNSYPPPPTAAANNTTPTTYPSHLQQSPNATTTPYASVYQAPTPVSSSLPLHHHPGSTGMVDADEGSSSVSGFMESARSWVSSAGSKLAEVEAEVWRRINDAHDK